MAFQSSTSTSTAPSGSSTNDTNDSTSLNPTSSLPFSFLVTFVAIFLFFLGCGLGSRRVTRTLRHNLGLEVTGLDGRRAAAFNVPRAKPIIWDVFPHELESSSAQRPKDRNEVTELASMTPYAWESLSPLSGTYVRPHSSSLDAADAVALPQHDRAHIPRLNPEPEPPPPPMAFRWPPIGGMRFMSTRGAMRIVARLPPTPTPIANQSASFTRSPDQTRRAYPELRWRGRRIPHWLARPLLPDQHDALQPWEGPEQVPLRDMPMDQPQTDALQVVVLISMPSPERPRRLRVREKAIEAGRRVSRDSGKLRVDVDVNSEEVIGEYVLGTVRIPWTESEVVSA